MLLAKCDGGSIEVTHQLANTHTVHDVVSSGENVMLSLGHNNISSPDKLFNDYNAIQELTP